MLKSNFTKRRFLGLFFLVSLLSCGESKKNNDAQTGNVDGNVKIVQSPKKDYYEISETRIGNLDFTAAINNAEKLLKMNGNKVIFEAPAKTDYFNSTDGSSPVNNAPILLSKIDNGKPFTFTSKVTPSFTQTGTYSAGVLYIYSDNSLYQKFCFEQDERGKHRVVTVRTVNTSDDNNHDEVNQPYVYMKISSDGKSIGSYYSLDNKNWQMVRLYKNDYPKDLFIGISSQSPKDPKSTSVFEEIKFENKSIKDFRIGI